MIFQPLSTDLVALSGSGSSSKGVNLKENQDSNINFYSLETLYFVKLRSLVWRFEIDLSSFKSSSW